MPSSASEVTLLPHPDSPTIPSVSPAATLNETPLTAWIVPRSVQKWTWRSSTASSGSPLAGVVVPTAPAASGPGGSDTAAELGVEGLAHRVADEVEAEHRDDDRGPGKSARNGAVWRYRTASVSIVPHSGVDGSCGPSPRKPSPAASMIAVAIARVPATITGDIAFGRMWPNRTFRLGTPTARAART